MVKMIITRGCDLSKWNQPCDINYKNYNFAIIRAGYGKNNIDTLFETHVKNCIKYNIPFGVYWFSYALNAEMAKREAEYCILYLERLGVKPEYPIYFDWESDSEHYLKKCTGKKINNIMYAEICRAFCNRVEEMGYYAGIYCDKSHYVWADLLGARYTIWLADWSGKNKSFYGRTNEVHMLQLGSINGVDYNICKIDFPKIIKNNKLNGW